MGHTTRGKTAANRLRRVDNFILLHEPSLLTRTDGLFVDSLFVDIGYGFDALVFSTNFCMGFDVEEFQTILPKNLIHHILPDETIYDFFEARKQSAKETSTVKTFGAKQWFIASAELIAHRGYPVNLHRKFLSEGYLIWGQS